MQIYKNSRTYKKISSKIACCRKLQNSIQFPAANSARGRDGCQDPASRKPSPRRSIYGKSVSTALSERQQTDTKRTERNARRRAESRH